MPFAATIYREPNLHHVRFWGHLTLTDTRQQFARAPATAGFFPGIPTLLDLRGLIGTEMNLADLMSLRDRMVDRHTSPGNPLRMALLVDSDMAFGIARIFDTLCSQTEALKVQIVMGLPEALAHLGHAGVGLEEIIEADNTRSLG